MEKSIIVKNLSIFYGSKEALFNVNVTLPKGRLIGIIGPNGGGKSTFLKGILNIVKVNSGKIEIIVEGRENLKKIAYIPQKNTIDWSFPATVLDMVMMGSYGKLGLFKSPKKNEKEKAIFFLEKVGMDKLLKRQISKLSGGERQRILIARALIQEAEIYLMDEPFQGIDLKTEKEIIKILKGLKDQGKTVLVVHHNLETVKEYFDYLIMLNKKIIASGEVKNIFTEKNIAKTFYKN